MKSRKIITVISLLFSVGILASCGTKNNTPSNSSQPSSDTSSTTSDQPAHVHSFVNKTATEQYLASAADCTHPAKYYYSCSCGEAWTETFESGEALGHSWHQEVAAKYLASAATCQSRAFYYLSCERCGAASTETFGVGECTAHKFTKVVISTETLKSAATCTAPAYYFYSCGDCGEIDTEHSVSVGDPLGHVWDEVADSTHLVNAATCLNKAIYHVSCTRCNADHPTMTFEYGDPLGHEFTAYVNNGDATCTENASETAHCNHAGCEATDTREVADSKLAHSLVNEALPQYVKVQATCLEDAIYYKHCEDCDFVSEETFEDTGSKLGHDISPITGHCVHEGCEEKTALCVDVNYGNGDFSINDTYTQGLQQDLVMDQKIIYDISFDGQVDTTNFYFIPRKSSSYVYRANLLVNAFDETGNALEVRTFTATYQIYIIESPIAKGSHVYIHLTAKLTTHEGFYIAYATHQFTNLRYVGLKQATCLTPKINSHIEFDESETLGKWIINTGYSIKDIDTFYTGSAGTGHDLTHHAATPATATSPALKEHWFCEKCGGYFLDPDVDEECEYADLYNNLIYGSVKDFYNIPTRGMAIKVFVTLHQDETPIDSQDERYVSQKIHVILEDGTDMIFVVTGIAPNNHMVEFLLRGDASVFGTNPPQAAYMNFDFQ